MNEPKKKLTPVLLRLFYGVETSLRCRDFSTTWRLFYDVEIFIAVYAVDTFGAKSFLGTRTRFTVDEYVKSLAVYPFGHRAILSSKN